MEHMPMLQLTGGRVPHFVFLPKFAYLHITQQFIYLCSRQKRHPGSRRIPLITDAEELPRENPTRLNRLLYTRKHREETRSRAKRQSKLGADKIVLLIHKIF